MRHSSRSARPHLLQLEDRITPAVAYALSNNALISFDTASPTVATAPLPLTGLNGDNLVAIDFRPQNGQLYGLASDGTGVKLYAISERTGAATPLTSAFQTFDTGAGGPMATIPITGSRFGIDFNPVSDQLRVVSNAGINFRIDPNTGLLIDGNPAGPGLTPDTALSASGVPAGAEGVAYTNDQANATATTLYAIDAATDRLYIQNTPAGGALTQPLPITIAGTPLQLSSVVEFDIPAGVNVATSNSPAVGSGFAVLQIAGQNQLYSIDLSTGAATLVGLVAGGAPVQGLAIQSEPAAGSIPAVGLTRTNGLIRFNSSAPGTATAAVPVLGLAGNENLVNIAYRPATGQLYGLVYDGTGVRLILINPQTGESTTAALLATPQQFTDGSGNQVPINATSFGMDFNPTVDRVRVVTNTGMNFRMNPNTGALLDGDFGMASPQPGINPDGAINGAATSLDATAYTNHFAQVAGSTATTQFTLDAATDTLYQQSLPNSGTQVNPVPVTLNGSRLDFNSSVGFGIPAGVRVAVSNTLTAGRALAALQVGAVTGLYSIELSTGVATFLGPIAAGTTRLAGLALGDSPVGTVQFAANAFAASEAASSATLTLTRSGGSVGNLTVVISATGGTAVNGTDFSGVPITVSFADGQTQASVPVSLLNRAGFQGNRTVDFTLTTTTGGVAIGATNAATLTILENDVARVTSSSVGGAVTTRSADGTAQKTFNPFPGFTGPITTAFGDFNGDGVPDLVVGAGFGGGPHVKVFDGLTQAELASFFAFDPRFTGGVFVAVGDVTGSGRDEIVVGAGFGGGPHVKVFAGSNFTEVRSFFAFEPGFAGGVRVAAADVLGNGRDDIIAAAGPGGGPRVRVLSGRDGSELKSLFAFETNFTGGVYVAAGDVNGDGRADLVFGAGETAPRVRAVSGRDESELLSFFAFASNFSGGVRVATSDLDGSGRDDILVGTGPGIVPSIRVFNGRTGLQTRETLLADAPVTEGFFVS